MNHLSRPKLYLGLLHHPVVNKKGEIIASAVTNLDLHDIARAACTYGVKRFFVITPLPDQQDLANRIVGHWSTGPGGAYNPSRKQAFQRIRISSDLAAACREIQSDTDAAPLVVATTAQRNENSLGFSELRKKIDAGVSCLLVFGTAWGLSKEALDAADAVLEPITGPSAYNHLSVRSAAAIVLDRLAGNRSEQP